MNPTMYFHGLATPNPDQPVYAVRPARAPSPWERRPELDRRAEPATPIDVDEDLPLETAAALEGRWRAGERSDLLALGLTVLASAAIALGVLLTG